MDSRLVMMDNLKKYCNKINRKVKLPSRLDIERELLSYKLSDYICIPSKHAQKSFTANGYEEDRTFINPYGVDIENFFPRKHKTIIYDVIMVGTWGMQKGCDILTEALKTSKLRFLHIGNIGDYSFPKKKEFKHIEHVDQMELGKYYNMAKISILPSRQDGFGLVLSQAMACGLPIVCTKDTGGEDLKQFLSDDKWIVVIEKTNAAELKAGILKALELYDELPEGYDYMKESRSELSWRGYGKRYADFLDNIYWGEKHRGNETNV